MRFVHEKSQGGSFETGVSRETLIKGGRCSKVSGQQVSRLSLSDGNRLNENDKDFSLCSK